jgi:hypothetical protein
MNARRLDARVVGRSLACAATVAMLSSATRAQGDGPRMYWKSLVDTSAITFWPISATGNSSPFDSAQVVDPNARFQADMALVGYHRMMDLFGRSATASFLLPVGNLNAEASGVPVSQQETASGFGDPTVQLDVNLIGAPAITDLPGLLRYEPTFTLDVLASVALPIGEYDENATLNLGQNRWYGRIGAPMLWSIGPWVPGQRTTVEVLPALWWFGDNSDYQGNQTLETDPIFGVEGHLTRDFTETAWGSLDAAWFSGGESTIGGVTGEDINNIGVGFTFGVDVSDNLSISTSYFSTIDDGGQGDLQGDQFRLMFTYHWHPLLEGMKRLSEH